MSPVQGIASCPWEDTANRTGVQSQAEAWVQQIERPVLTTAHGASVSLYGSTVEGDVGEVSGEGWDGDQE